MTTTLRHPGRTRLPPRWAVRTAHLIPLLTLPAMLWRVPLAFGFSMGMLHDGVPMHATGGVAVYVLALAVISEAVALLSLGLVRPWGEVVPAWVPLLRGRRIPPAAVVAAATTGALALIAICVYANVNLVLLSTADFVNGWRLALAAACYLPLLLWGPLLLMLTWEYRRRRGATLRSPAASRAAVWASIWAAAFLALHVYWAFGGRVGFGDQTDPIPATTSSLVGWVWTLVVLAMFVAGPVVPLALVRPWGSHVPRRLLVVLMWIGAIVLVARGGLGLLDGLIRALGVEGGLTRLPYEQTLGSAHPSAYTLWSSAAIDVVFLVGGLLFTRAAALTGKEPV